MMMKKRVNVKWIKKRKVEKVNPLSDEFIKNATETFASYLCMKGFSQRFSFILADCLIKHGLGTSFCKKLEWSHQNRLPDTHPIKILNKKYLVEKLECDEIDVAYFFQYWSKKCQFKFAKKVCNAKPIWIDEGTIIVSQSGSNCMSCNVQYYCVMKQTPNGYHIKNLRTHMRFPPPDRQGDIVFIPKTGIIGKKNSDGEIVISASHSKLEIIYKNKRIPIEFMDLSGHHEPTSEPIRLCNCDRRPLQFEVWYMTPVKWE